jgi:hypothetical protein
MWAIMLIFVDQIEPATEELGHDLLCLIDTISSAVGSLTAELAAAGRLMGTENTHVVLLAGLCPASSCSAMGK